MTRIWDRDEQGDPPAHFTGRIDYKTRGGHSSHFYTLDGEKVDGVTTIVKQGMPRPEGLQRWDRQQVARSAVDQASFIAKMDKGEAEKHLVDQPNRELNKAAARGTTVHGWADAFAETGELPALEADDPLAGYAHSLERFLLDWQPRFLLNEVTVFNSFHLYAGTLDAIAELPGLGHCLIDYKTSKRAYGEHALQLSAYRYATFYIDEDETRFALPRIDSCAIVLINDDGYRIVPVQADRAAFAVFLRAKAMVAHGKNEKNLVGAPLTAPPSSV